MKTATLLLGCCLLAELAACSAEGSPQPSAAKPDAGSPLVAGRTANAAAGSGVTPQAGTNASQAGSAAGSGNVPPNGVVVLPADDGCGTGQTFKREGCPCRAGETAACWTGSVADRNVGACHDGLQLCTGGAEFGEWGPCNGEELTCGTDAGVPPPPPPPPAEEGGCPCIPGAIIQCSEDCTTGIICSLTASKTCLPDGSWSVCHEDVAVTLDLPGFQCRNMLHGCLSDQGDGEIYVGDCSKQFKCGRAPTAL